MVRVDKDLWLLLPAVGFDDDMEIDVDLEGVAVDQQAVAHKLLQEASGGRTVNPAPLKTVYPVPLKKCP